VSTTDKCIGANAAIMPSSGPGACYCEIVPTGADNCTECDGGSTTRRRSSTCTPCMIGKYDTGGVDDCSVVGHIPLKNKGFDKCLDFNAEHGHNVYMHDCDGSARQMWHFEGEHLKSVESKEMCLAYEKSPAASQMHNVFMRMCADTLDMSWYFAGEALKNKAVGWQRDLCLDYDDAGTHIYMNGCIPTAATERWYFSAQACHAGHFQSGRSCMNCVGGSTSRRRSVECAECAPGSYDAGFTDDCTACPGGTMRRRRAVSCEACPRGYYNPGGRDNCMQCVGGHIRRRRANDCELCPNNTYQHPGNWDKCYRCVGQVSRRRRGATHCDMTTTTTTTTVTTVTSTSTITTVSFCSAGLYLLPDGTCAHCTGETRRRRATTCTECAKGMFDPGDDRDDCLDCKGGQVQRRRATSCTACAAGYYDKGGYDDCHVCSGGSVRRRRALICNHCTLGMYWEGHKDECTACNGGFVRRRNQGGALECTVCPPGKYDPGKDDDCMECNGGSTGRRRAEACTDCPNGYYDAGNADDCRQCEGGSTSRRRATTCTECELGFYDAGDLDDCEKCAGGFVDRRRATQCSNCSDGYYDPPTNNLDECINCAAGDVRRRRADACTACPAGKYDPTDNIGDSCMTCNGGQTARRRSTTCEECDVGWYDHAGHDDCQQCLGGSVRRRLALTCEECGPGYYFTGDSDDCKQCQGGSTRRRAREIGACTMCLNGTYDEGNLDDCQVCEGGETRRRREAYSCLPTTSTTTTTTTITTTTITFSLEQMPVELHTCGATGRNGPTNDQCKHYPAYSINKVQVFEGYQYYKIPTAGGYTITAKGARGGNHGQGLGGYGAKVTGTYNFNKNDELLMVIGQVGYDNPNYTAQWGGGGGGGTFVSMIHSSGDIVVSNIMPEDKTLALLIAAGGGAGRYDEANSGQSAGGRHSKGDPTTQATGIRKGPGGGGGYRLDGLGGGPHVVNEKQASAKAFMHGATGGYTTNGTEYFGGFGGGGAPFHGGGGGGGYDGGDCCQGRRRHCDHNCLGGSSYEALQRVHGGFGGIGCGGATANHNDEEGSVHIEKVVALFTTCGKRGRHGPNQMDCSVNDGRLYAGDSPQITLSQGYRFFTVPWDGSYTIRAFGSRGGDHGSGLGGYGAEAKMEQTFVQGDQMVVLVGQHGWDNPVDADGGGGGGGGTFVAKTLVYSNAGDQLGWPGDQIDTGLDDMKVHIQLLLAAGGGSGMRDTNTTGQAAGGRGESCDVDSAATGDDTGGGGGGGYKLNGKGGGNNKGIAFLKGAVGGGNNFSANGTEIRYGGFGGGGRSMDGGGGGGGYDGGDCCLKSNGLGGRTCNFECTGGCSMGTKLIGNCNHGDGAVILSKVPYSVITFTTCEKSGRYGPTQADCAATPGISVQNGFQKFMINKTGSYRIMAAGARGGNHGGGKGGYGARVQYVYHLQRGDVLVAAVGQTGWDNPSDSDWGGGGGGGTYLGRISNGASDPVISVLNTKVKLMLLAGGGAGMKAIEPGEHYPNNGRAQGGIASGGDAATAAAGGSSGSGAGYMMDGAGGGQASKSFANGAVGGQHTNPNLRRRTQRDHLHFGGFGGGGGPYNGAGGGGGYHGGECCLGGGSRRRACDASCGGGTSFGGMGHPSINKGEGYVEVTQVPPGVVEFTTCEKIGRLGPESSDCNQIGVTVDKGYQFYTIPVTGKYHLQAYGSRGGDHGLARGGKGALAMRSNLAFYEGERLVVLVGQRGWDNPSDRDWGGGGGGASFVAKWKAGADYNITVLTDSVKYPNGVTVELILAAGGGAGVMDTLNQLTTQGEGGLATAGNADEAAAGDKNGGGGGFKLDGLGGIWKPAPTSLPGSTAKSFLNGAMGGGSTNQWGGFGGGGRPYDGAGGGGGYSGGACTMGGDNKACRGGGSWAGTGSDGSVMENYNDGDGLVVLTRTEPSLAVAFAAPSR